MKKVPAVVACVTLLLAQSVGPWRHVHDHGHDAHHAAEALHAHQWAPPSGPLLHAHSPDEDARSLTEVAGSLVSSPTGLPAIVEGLVSSARPASAITLPGLDAASCHDPPPWSSADPRGPPPPSPSLLFA